MEKNDMLTEIETSLKESKVSFEDLETLEEMVTPGCGGGCDCYAHGNSCH